MKALKPILFLVVLAFMVWGIWVLRDKLTDALTNAHWGYLAGAATISLLYLILNASVWGLIVRLTGVRPNRLRAACLWIECEAMRWLPGGIWGYASRVVEAQRIGLNKTNGAITLTLELAITVLAWGTLGLVGALLSPPLRYVAMQYLERLSLPPTLAIAGALVMITVGLIVLTMDLLGLRSKLLHATSDLRAGLAENWALSLRAYGEYLALSVFYALGFLLCLQGTGVTPLPSLLEAGGAYGLAWIVGLLAIGAPGGMGVREGFLYLVFQPLGIGAEIATAAILWRLIQIITELILLLVIKTGKLAP